MQLICKTCNLSFEAERQTRKYCSSTCDYASRRKERREVNQDYLHEILDYDFIKGGLYWKVSPAARVKVGDRIGTQTKDRGRTGGYRIAEIFGKHYPEHRLVWMYFCNYFPEEVDHKNLNKVDNRIGNLRGCSSNENKRNREIDKSNTSGYKGVISSFGRWRVDVAGKYRGTFDTQQEAVAVYNSIIKEEFGEFARLTDPDTVFGVTPLARKVHKFSKSGYNGIRYQKSRNCFFVCIRLDSGKLKAFGKFDNAEDAAREYDYYVIKNGLHPKYLNFPPKYIESCYLIGENFKCLR